MGCSFVVYYLAAGVLDPDPNKTSELVKGIGKMKGQWG